MKIKNILASVSTLTLLVFGLAVPVATLSGNISYAADQCATAGGIQCAMQGADQAKTGGAKSNNLNDVIKLAVNIMLFIIGALSVIMIVVGGIKYTVSNGNAEQIKSAKNTLMYAIVGVIVAILAYAIVNFVVTQLT